MSQARKYTVVVAATVELLCPFCGEAQPDPGAGSEFWEVGQLHDFQKRYTQAQRCRPCVSCGELVIIEYRRPQLPEHV